jgi:hypothetical protein
LTEENQIPSALTDELKKKLQAQFTLCIQYEFYEVTKNPKGRFSYTLKSKFAEAMKPTAKDEISIDNKFTAHYLIDTLLNFQKRFVSNEYKQRKYKKKFSKLMDDLCEPNVETNIEPNVNEEIDIKSKLEEVIVEPTESQTKKQSNSFKLPPRIRKF